MSAPPPRSRRGHTRRLLLIPLIGLAAVIGGTSLLEAAAPQIDPDVVAALDLTDDLPPLGITDVPTCTRSVLEELDVGDLRGDFREGGRVSSEQIYACPAAWDQQQVTFVGEAVGEVLPRRGGAWVQVNDDAYALETGPLVGHRERAGSNSGLAVWLPESLSHRIDGVGRPARRGTVVQLTGTIERTDPDDGGGITLRASELDVLAPATTVAVPLHTLQLVVAVVLALAAAGATLWSRRVRRR